MSDITQFGSYFVYNGIQSNTYGVWISGEGTFSAPVRDYESIAIPGKSGKLILQNNRLENIDITYPCFIAKQFNSRFDTFKAALLSQMGYFSLADTYHPDYFRMAAYKGGITPETGPYNKSGSFDIVFDCMPQCFLNSGIIFQTFSASGSISNPTAFTAKPLIRVYGYGTLRVGSVTVTITQHSRSYIDLDCESMEAFYGANNMNGYVTVSSDEFPTLGEGSTSFTLSGGVSRISIMPRWWTI